MSEVTECMIGIINVSTPEHATSEAVNLLRDELEQLDIVQVNTESIMDGYNVTITARLSNTQQSKLEDSDFEVN